jgi:hypothetical protein
VGELLIRPGPADHKVVANLLAPGGSSALARRGPLITRLVVDAHVAAKKPEFAEAASQAGIPYLVDPLTPLLQGELREADPWAKLSFGQPEAISVEDLADSYRQQRLVADVVDFEIEAGATAIIPPYLYASAPEDPRFSVTLDFIRLTDRYLSRNNLRLPLIPIFCGQLHRFASDRAWVAGVDRFRAVAADHEVQFVALCLSPAGNGSDSYPKLLSLFRTAERMLGTRTRVVAWRQGIYGEALVASGLSGYETGIGTREQCNVASLINNRRPPKPGSTPSGGWAQHGVFLQPLGRSVSKKAAQALLGSMPMRPKLMCDDEGCCPNGVTSTLDRAGEHAVRTRARMLAELDAMPERQWRLHRISQQSTTAVTLAEQANRVLRENDVRLQIKSTGMDSLARLAEHLKSAGGGEPIAGTS